MQLDNILWLALDAFKCLVFRLSTNDFGKPENPSCGINTKKHIEERDEKAADSIELDSSFNKHAGRTDRPDRSHGEWWV